jgi:hypothetical protein
MIKSIQNRIVHAKRFSRVAALLIAAAPRIALAAQAQTTGEPHGWPNTETLKTRVGEFEFKNGYPTDDTAQRLRDLQTLNRATEVYLTQIMRVDETAWREGMRAFGSVKPQQVVIWEKLLDPQSLLLTSNAETVYAVAHLRLQDDGPTVVEAPPNMLGFLRDGLQRYLADIGPLGKDQGKGGKYLVLPPGFRGDAPDGYFVVQSPTHSVNLSLRGFQVNGKTDQAVGLMKQLEIYPLAETAAPPAMEFMNGSGRAIDTVFPDSFRFFELLAMLVNEEPVDIFDPLERSMMQAIGIEKGKAFNPDARLKALLSEAARLGGAMARANSYASTFGRFYPDRHWQGVPTGISYTFIEDGIPQVDTRNWLYYTAIGNSPAIMAKNVGQGSQYLWTYRDADGQYLDGARSYRLHIPPNIPAKAFWSVLVYDTLSRSQLQNGQPFPAVSSYTKPLVNADGSIDIDFGPRSVGRRRRKAGQRRAAGLGADAVSQQANAGRPETGGRELRGRDREPPDRTRPPRLVPGGAGQ